MAVIFYDKLYLRKGTRRQAHFIKPRTLEASEFEFPVSSVMYWWKGEESIAFLNKNIPYFQKVSRGVVSSIIGYSSETELYGKVIQRTIQPNKWIKESQDQCKEFKFLKIGQQFKITPKILKIMNLGCVSAKYKYPIQILRRYHIYRNIFKTVMKSLFIENNDRHVFVNIDLPNEIPSRIFLNKFSTRLLNGHLDLLPTYEYFNIIELWKFLDPELNSESIIYQSIPKDKWNKVNILFCKDKKVVLIRLSVLAALVKDYGIVEPGIKERDPQMAKKIFHTFLNNILASSAMSEAELEKLEQELDNPNSKISKQILGEEKEGKVDSDDIDPDDDEPESAEELAILEAAEEKGNVEEDLEDDEDAIDDDGEDDIIDMDGDLQDEEEEEVNVILGEDTSDLSELDVIYKDIEEMLHESNEYDNVYRQLEKMVANKSISKKEYDTNIKILSEQPKRKDPYGSKKSLVEMLDNKLDKVEISQEDMSITDNPVVFDKTSNQDVIGSITKNYIENQFQKDIVRAVYSMQNGNLIIQDYQIFKSETILGGLEEHVIEIRSLTGKASTVKIMLPKIETDGTFKISNQTYTMRSQRADAVLRKISSTRAALSSYYGKFFIEKASFKKNDTGYYLFNIISKMYSEGLVTDLIALPISLQDVVVPIDYSHLSRYLKYFKYQDYSFSLDYTKRADIVGGSVNEYEKGGKYVVIGSKGRNPIVMEVGTNIIYKCENGGKQLSELGTIYTILKIDRLKQPVEHCDIRIFSMRIPVVVVLGYYVGLEQLIKLLKVQYEKLDVNKRVPIDPDWYTVRFKDIKLRIKRDYGSKDLILGGLTAIEKATSQIQYKVVNTRSSYQVLWNKLGYQLAHTNEIKLMENMFVDPITLSLLEKLKLPTNIKGLIIKACEILVDDNFKNPNDLSQMLIKGYERIAGMMYNELVKSIREQESKSMFSKAKLVVNPYSVIQSMNEDSATTLVDDLNPMASLKQREDVTYLGALGRNKISMGKGTREYNSTEIGVISEAAKDNSDVGITAYLTAAPKIDNIRGKTTDADLNNTGWSSILSTSAMLSPFGINDDSKRLKIRPFI